MLLSVGLATPLTGADFHDLMGRVGRPAPGASVAVAVSGGADSMALLLLAAEWAKTEGIHVTALTVDHGLRPGSAAEALQVGAWCRERGVVHETLQWVGLKPVSGVQEAAREARYGILTRWCREHDHPDLLTGHHLDDQAETVLMRMCRGSGVNGLAGMALVTVRDGVRIARPLLKTPRKRLVALMQARHQPWIDDPTNLDRRYTRVSLRSEIALLDGAGLPLESFARAAVLFGELRGDRDREISMLAARAVALFPEGYAEVDGDVFRAADNEPARELLGRLVSVVGGGRYPVRRARLERLYRSLAGTAVFTRQTLGHCLVEPLSGGFRVCREAGTIRDVRSASTGTRFLWDGRFDMTLHPERLPRQESVRIAALGDAGRKATSGRARRSANLPHSVQVGLPALWIGEEVIEVPLTGFGAGRDPIVARVRFRPDGPLCGPPFRLA